MARKRTAVQEVVAKIDQVVNDAIEPQQDKHRCRKCRYFSPNNKLKGYWEGLCGQGKGMVKDDFSCELWEARNG
jgi:hypothetical protein